jgi:hypothetical protein
VGEALYLLRLRHDVKVSASRQLQLTMIQQLHMPGLLAHRATNAFSKSANFTFVGGEQRDNPISFT